MKLSIYAEERKFCPRRCQGSRAASLTQNLHRFGHWRRSESGHSSTPKAGTTVTLCDAASGRGGTWNRDGMIVFAPTISSELYRISAGGGRPADISFRQWFTRSRLVR